MRTEFNANLGAHVTTSDDGRVYQIRHSQGYWESGEAFARVSAESYIRKFAGILQLPPGQLENLERKVSFFDPQEQPVEYQLNDEKHLMDGTTVDFYQTYLNTPVWRHGVAVLIKQNPDRVVEATRNVEENLEGRLPDREIIDRFRKLFGEIEIRKAEREIRERTNLPTAVGEGEAAEGEAEALVRQTLSRREGKRRRGGEAAFDGDRVRVLSGKFFVYKYTPERRYAGRPQAGPAQGEDTSTEAVEPPLPELPAVNDTIESGRAYLVAEVIFETDRIVWLILLELETSSILYIERMTCGINGLVFRRDPINKSGNLAITSNLGNAVLNMHRDDEVLTDLASPVGGNQSLTGTYVRVEDVDPPSIAPPTQPAAPASDFDYDVRTNDFGAVNAYYHQTQLFRLIESLGFPKASYFDGTTFPTRVDHRARFGTTDGVEINAYWSPNGSGGTGHQGYCLGDLSDTANPLCRSVDPYVHWHEMGGHGTLGDHAGSGNLGFAHSHGDGLAAIQNDPESALRATADRFRYAPFRPSLFRRFDRAVSGGWAWGGANDGGGYDSEEILATTHFRIYRAIGGDSDDLARRLHASRVATYLILRTTGQLTSGTNPSNWDPAAMANVPGRGAQLWCDRMQAVDLLNWTSEGLAGGAYNKVIRWAFEKQGSFQPTGAPVPVTTEGAPPAVDVYVDDGRAGEYGYQAVHWQNQSIWNRVMPDGMAGHQNAIEGATNYAYVRVKNRGTQASGMVTVRGFHSLPGAGLTWPTDFVEMIPVGGLTLASLPGGSSGDLMAGPFTWVPNINAYGHDCVLMITSAAGDPSNIDNFTGTETIQEWRLVPHDNNIGQRNVSVVPGAGGPEALVASLDGAFFMAGNNLNRRADMELRASMPQVLRERGWSLGFDGLDGANRFALASGARRRVTLRLKPGSSFTAADIAGTADRQIDVSLYANDLLIGGMTYYVDPDLRGVSGGKKPTAFACDDQAQALIDCLKVSGGRKVKKVRVRKVSIDVELEGGDCD